MNIQNYTISKKLVKNSIKFKEKRVCHSFLFLPFYTKKKPIKIDFLPIIYGFELANATTANLTATASAISTATAEKQ